MPHAVAVAFFICRCARPGAVTAPPLASPTAMVHATQPHFFPPEYPKAAPPVHHHAPPHTHISLSLLLLSLSLGIRQASVGKAILEDRALRKAAPLNPALVDAQGPLLAAVRSGAASGAAAAFKLKSRVAVVIAARRLQTGVVHAAERRRALKLRKLKAAAWVVVAAAALLKASRRTASGEAKVGRGSAEDGGEGGWQLAGEELAAAVKVTKAHLKASLPHMLRFPNDKRRGGTAGGDGGKRGRHGGNNTGGDEKAAAGGLDGAGFAPLGTGQVAAKARQDFARIGKRVAAMLQAAHVDSRECICDQCRQSYFFHLRCWLLMSSLVMVLLVLFLLLLVVVRGGDECSIASLPVHMPLPSPPPPPFEPVVQAPATRASTGSTSAALRKSARR